MPNERSNDRPDDDTIASLFAAIDETQDEIAGIRRVVDEIRGDAEWATRNHRADEWRPIQPRTSMPLDPLAADWSSRVNRFTAADLPAKQPATTQVPSRADRPQQGSFDTGEDAEGLVFCCDAPDLQWTGHPDFPGIGCLNCGYVVAEAGSIIPQPRCDLNDGNSTPEPVGQPQRELF